MSLLLTQLGGAAPQTITGSAIAQVVAFGTGQIQLTVGATGLAQVVGFGTGSLKLTISATGLAQTVTFGTGKLNETISGNGLAVPLGFGAGTIQLAIQASGIAQPIEFGTGTISIAGTPQDITGIGLEVPITLGTGNLSSVVEVQPETHGGWVFFPTRRERKPQTIGGESLRIPVQFGDGQLQFVIRARGLSIIETQTGATARLSQNLYGFGSTRPTLTGRRGSIELAKAQELGGIGHRVRLNVGEHNLKPVNPEHDEELAILLSLME